MSPTAAKLTLNADLSGATGGAGCGAGGSSTTGAGGASTTSGTGVDAQAASNRSAKAEDNRRKLVTESNSHHINLRSPKTAASDVQFIKIFDGSDIDPKVVAIIDACALDTRFDTVKG